MATPGEHWAVTAVRDVAFRTAVVAVDRNWPLALDVVLRAGLFPVDIGHSALAWLAAANSSLHGSVACLRVLRAHGPLRGHDFVALEKDTDSRGLPSVNAANAGRGCYCYPWTTPLGMCGWDEECRALFEQ